MMKYWVLSPHLHTGPAYDDITGQIHKPIYVVKASDHEAAITAIREECAKVAENYRLEAGEGNQITLSGFVGRRIADAIRTAQPGKAQEGA
jgi:hypothetical protein